jgi:hypothetical protein
MPFVRVGVAWATRLPAFHSPDQNRSLAEEIQLLQFLLEFQEAIRGGFSGRGHRVFPLHCCISYGINTVG